MREVPSGQGVVTRTKRQGCDESVIVILSRGTEVASRCCRRLPPVASRAGGGLFSCLKKIHEWVVLGILTGLAVLLSYVFAIQTPFVRITFGFLPIALAGAFYGPWKAGLVGALDNLIGTAIIGTSIFFPGFTLSDFLTGFLFGWFFYHKEIRFPYVCVPFLLVMLLIHLGLNTLWLVLYYDKAASAIFLSRVIKNLLCFPMEVGLFLAVYKAVGKQVIKGLV